MSQQPDNLQQYPAFETLALHSGYCPDPTTQSRAVPLYQTTSYVFKDTDDAADLFALKKFGNIYTRLMNPTTDVFEKRVASLEGGVAALGVSSGQAAISATILTLAQAGDEIVASTDLYGGTVSLFNNTLKRFGITVKFVSPHDLDAWEKAITPKTKALYCETLGNPKLEILDLKAISEIGKKHGIPLVVDNTVATPYLCNPIKHGANIVIHSATKFIGGQGTSIGGVIVDGGNFDWQASGRFADFVDPDPAYHGLKFWETFGAITFIIRARVLFLRDIGTALSPFNAWLFIQGLETLAVRIQRHSENALKLAQYLEKHPYVSWVNYPGLPSSPTYDKVKTYLPEGQGALIGFGVKGGEKAAIGIIESVSVFSHLANIGDTKSLIIHPASTTHSQLDTHEQADAGVTPDYIRLSVGLENIDDLIADLDQALSKAESKFGVQTAATV